MFVSWVDFSLEKNIAAFSLSLEKNDFLFLAGETEHNKLLRALAGFLPEQCNYRDSVRINGKSIKNEAGLNSILLPKNAAQSLPPSREIGNFALDISGMTKKEVEESALKNKIEKHIINSKPDKLSPLVLQKISLWLCSLKPSDAIFIEEPEEGFFNENRPFDFLQGLLRNSITNCIIYLPAKREVIMQKAKAMQFCRTRIAVFCGDRLVEEGELSKILEKPIHQYTAEWLDFGVYGQRKSGALWNYCKRDCVEQYNCAAKHNTAYSMWDYNPAGLHKVICRGFIN